MALSGAVCERTVTVGNVERRAYAGCQRCEEVLVVGLVGWRSLVGRVGVRTRKVRDVSGAWCGMGSGSSSRVGGRDHFLAVCCEGRLEVARPFAIVGASGRVRPPGRVGGEAGRAGGPGRA